MAKRTNKTTTSFRQLTTGLVVAAVLLFSVYALTQLVQQPTRIESEATGNGAPSGVHYNLNLIGVPKGKTADMTRSEGRRIFVPLWGSCKISLAMGDFQVLDGNCTDGSARFQLPSPDPDNDGVTTYSVWARALGKPGGSSETTTCATDPVTGETYCSVYTMVQMRNKGKSSFSDVSKQLLYIYADIDGDGNLDRMPLFDDRLKDYYWQYDNKGLKLLQLRFYEISSTVPAP
ncbi:MAG: hypothetical protein Q8P89_00140 [bacterium]|nr:hypothetical protein [bacterium]